MPVGFLSKVYLFGFSVASIFKCREPPTLSITPFLIGRSLLSQPSSRPGCPRLAYYVDSLYSPHLFSPLEILEKTALCILVDCLGLCFFRLYTLLDCLLLAPCPFF